MTDMPRDKNIYEDQFGERIRDIHNTKGAAPNRTGSGGFGNRSAAWVVGILIFVAIRTFIAVSTGLRHTPPPPIHIHQPVLPDVRIIENEPKPMFNPQPDVRAKDADVDDQPER